MIQKLQSKELKKHVAAIRISNEVGLVPRKAWNVLLLNAYDGLKSKKKHNIPVSVLCDVIGYDRKNFKSLKKGLVKLTSTAVSWDIGGGALVNDAWCENFISCSLLSEIRIDNGTLHYEYSSGLSELLYEPAIYQKINITQQNLFSSSYGLALWENCIRFINVKSTGFSDIEEWRDLLGAKGKTYIQYRFFKSKVLQPAINEVNKVSNIEITLKTKKKGNKIIQIGFDIKEKEQTELLSGNRLKEFEESEEFKDLAAYGIHKVKAIKWLDDYGYDYIREKLDFVKSQGQSGRVKKSLSGLLVKAVTEDYQSDDMVQKRQEQERQQKEALARKEAERQKKRQEQRDALANEFTKAEIDKYLSKLTKQETDDLLAQAKKENPMLSSMMTSLDSPMCLAFLLPRIPDYEKNKEVYIKQNLKL